MATGRSIPSSIVFRAIKPFVDVTAVASKDLYPSPHVSVYEFTRKPIGFRNTAILPDTRSSCLTNGTCWSFASSYFRGHGRDQRSTRLYGIRTLYTSVATVNAEQPGLDEYYAPDDLEPLASSNPFFPAGVYGGHSSSSLIPNDKRSSQHTEEQGEAAAATAAVKTTIDTTQNFLTSDPASLTSLIPPYIPVGNTSPLDDQPKHVHLKNFGFQEKFAVRNLDPRHDYLYSHILTILSKHGHVVALQVFEGIMKEYVFTGLKADWELAKQVYLSMCYHFHAQSVRVIRNSVIKSMLQESPPRFAAVSLFFETIESDKEPSDKHVRSYLIAFCDEVQDPELQLAEFHKIMQGIQRIGLSLTAGVLLPVIQPAIAANDPERAHRLMTKLSQRYDLSIDFGALNEVIKAYGRQQNWSAIDDILANLHEQGYCRAKPIAFAALARTVIHFFAANHTPDRTFDFLTYLVNNHGLVPTASLSIGVLKSFVAAKRYDLVQRWIRERQVRFPSISSPIRSPLAAYAITDAWSEVGISPTDIWLTCRGLAQSALRDPFSDEFRLLTNELLLNWLHKHTKWFATYISANKRNIDVERFHDLDSACTFALDLVKSMEGMKPNLKRLLLSDEFSRHVVAAQQTDLLMNHFKEYLQQHGPIMVSHGIWDLGRVYTEHAFKEPPTVSTLNLPPKNVLAMKGKELVQATKALFKARNSSRQYSRWGRYRMLADVAEYLKREQRYLDCAVLIKEFWNSGHTKPSFLSHAMMHIWVQISIELHDQKLFHDALWASIDAPPRHLISDRFLLLVRIAIAGMMRHVEGGARLQRPNELEELKYLVSRLYRRKWQQEGCPEAKETGNPYLRKWKEDMSRSIQLPQVRRQYRRYD